MKIMLANIPTQILMPGGKEKYFVKAGCRWPYSITKHRNKSIDYKPFPFYLAYTSSLLKSEGYEVIVLDAVTLNYSEKRFKDKFRKYMPDVIVTESQTPTIKHDLRTLEGLKKIHPDVKIILCGPHPTTFAESILKKNKIVDVVLLREYEFSCLGVIKSNFKGLEKIAGVAFRKGKKIVKTEPVEVDVNKLPFPDRDSFPSTESPDVRVYWDGFCQLRPAIQLHASRGCPFRCNFCLWNQVMYANKPYRPIDAKRVVEEMIHVKKRYGANEIYFDDDTFTGNKEHVLSICREINKRKLNVRWSCMGDAMITDKEMLDAMASAGCIGIKFGVEAGNKEVLKAINKPIDFDKIRTFTKVCAGRKIKTHATFTFGAIGETRESMRQTLEYAKSLDIDNIQFSITTPFPGTRYFETMDNKGRILTKDWEKYDGTNSSVVDFGVLSSEEVVAFYKKAHSEWLKHKKKDYRWLLRKVYFNLRSLPRRSLRENINKVKLIVNSRVYGSEY